MSNFDIAKPEIIANIAASAKSLREDFWNNFDEIEILRIQDDMMKESKKISKMIKEEEGNSIIFSEMIYNSDILKNNWCEKLDQAQKEMRRFFEEVDLKWYWNEVKMQSLIGYGFGFPYTEERAEKN